MCTEFFQLLVAQLFDASFGMFRLTETKRDLWFNTSGTSVNDPQEYQLVGVMAGWVGGWMETVFCYFVYCMGGWVDCFRCSLIHAHHIPVQVGVLIGLAIYNAALLDLHFPRVVYKKLLDLPVSLADLGEIEPELMAGLKKLLEYDEEGEEGGGGKIEDVFCLSFEVDWVEWDEVKRHELKPGGKDLEVTKANRAEYVELYVQWLLTGSIAKSFDDFKAGFDRVMASSSISLLRPEELMLLVCGTPHLNFHELEAVTRYEGYKANDPVVRAFWATVHEMDLESQRKLLMFATGSAKAPIGGLGRLSFLIQRAGPDSDHLPTAHVCFNTVILPAYQVSLRE